MADPTNDPTSGDGRPVDDLGGAPPPKPGEPAGVHPAKHVIETPEELQVRARHEQELHKHEEAGAAVAATGLGCLSLALLPWSIGIVVLVAILLMWLFHGGR
jgi:hypothetical protein